MVVEVECLSSAGVEFRSCGSLKNVALLPVRASLFGLDARDDQFSIWYLLSTLKTLHVTIITILHTYFIYYYYYYYYSGYIARQMGIPCFIPTQLSIVQFPSPSSLLL